MTRAPSAAVGKRASNGPRNSSTATTDASATSECSWVRAPEASPIAVRLALLLTGKPRNKPAPMLDAPTASNSWFASMVWPLWVANARAVRTTSV